MSSLAAVSVCGGDCRFGKGYSKGIACVSGQGWCLHTQMHVFETGTPSTCMQFKLPASRDRSHTLCALSWLQTEQKAKSSYTIHKTVQACQTGEIINGF